MLRPLERTDSAGVRGVRIGVGRGQHARGKRGVVAAAMLGMQAQHDVQHARFLSRELAIGTQHGQDGLGRGLTGNEAMHDHGAVIVSSLLRVVGQHHDARQTRDQRDGGVDLVMSRTILGVRVVGVQQQDGALQHVHDVGRGVAHDHRGGEAVGQFALGIERGDEAVELLLCGQLAHEQQVRHLLEVEAAIGHAGVQQVVHVVAAIAQHTLVGYLLAV